MVFGPSISPLVVVDDVNICRDTVCPAKANAPLAIDADAVLTLSVSNKGLEHVSRRYAQIIQIFRSMKDNELAVGKALNILREAFDELPPPDFLGVLVGERFDHKAIVTRPVNTVKRYDWCQLRLSLESLGIGVGTYRSIVSPIWRSWHITLTVACKKRRSLFR